MTECKSPFVVKRRDIGFYANNPLDNNIDDYPCGIVLSIDKPYRWTSADVVRKIKFSAQRFFHKKNIKVGHAGTLDPLATGVLLVCLGKATKMAEALQARRKEYIATVRVGATTPCFDLEKEIDAVFPYEHITRKAVMEAIGKMTGEQEQIPPMFSAKLIDGKRAYEMARAGKEVEMKASVITIYGIELLDFNLPDIKLRISCSKGTYIRSFARDLGVMLGSGAHLVGLQRSVSGNFCVEDSITVDDALELFSKKK